MSHTSGYVLCGGIVGLLMTKWKGVGTHPVRFLCSYRRCRQSGRHGHGIRSDKMIRKAFLMSVHLGCE
ncbi:MULTISPECIES: L-rhamnose/proton symporter RhaT [Aeromonas]|uniref:L-rhamnose/proton symporter RhaT n=1 Tax=Aeromonas TaxID=642 RepID=UPI002F405EE0